MSMRKGTNVPLSASALRIEVGRRRGPGVPEVAACALLLADGRVRTDDDLVSAAHPRHPSDAVRHLGAEPERSTHGEELTIALDAVEPGVDRIVLAACVDSGSFGDVPGLFVRLADLASGGELARFEAEDAGVETAYLLGEVYRRQGAWKFRATGQGYAHGPAGLTADFGVRAEAAGEVSPSRVAPRDAPTPPRAPGAPRTPDLPRAPDLPVPPSAPTPDLPAPGDPTPGTPAPPRTSTDTVPAQGARPVRVTLTKDRPAVSLTKQGGTSGAMRVNLNWQRAQPSQQRGLFSRLGKALAAPQEIDLDLGALWELTDGRKGVVQALGDTFGSYARAPYISLDGDDRTGAVETGENLTINLDHTAELRRVLIFVTIYEGAESFAGLHATVTLQPQHGAPVDFSLDECTVRSRVAALALLTNRDGDLVIEREARYLVPGPGVSMQRAVDEEYGWGMRWTPGRK